MRLRRHRHDDRDHLADALRLLAGWAQEGPEIRRTLHLDDSQHAALTERIQVFAEALQLRPTVRRLNGYTQIQLDASAPADTAGGAISFAARVEGAYRTITGAA